MRTSLVIAALGALQACSSIDNPTLCTPGNCGGGAGGGASATGGGSSSAGGTASAGGGSGGGSVTAGGAATAGGASGGGLATGGGTASAGGAATAGGTAAAGGASSAGGAASAGGTASAGGAATGGGSACAEAWQCGAWQPSTAGMATRTCIDTNFCGSTATKPSEGPTALPPLNDNYFRCNVQPILAKSCAMIGCHGTLDTSRPFRVFARGRERNAETVTATHACPPTQGQSFQLYLPTVAATASCDAATPLSANERQLNFDNARCFALGVAAAQSELLQQPLRGNATFTHRQIKPWTTSNADYQVVLNWLNGMTLATCNSGTN
ncbi:MAG: hypothetical protein GQE15_30295 [Archangiaceae bacterium]|nr:hypothetical protein [Archangiaceae bacterium]